ncbi:21117_t:CDS:2, partial [Rhizophagus irregularis]
YANDGDLQNYLKNTFKDLTWDDKKKLAFQIADGLNYLHNENILHRDLVNNDNKVALAVSISNGAREVTILGTPKEYENLYKNCWNQEPEERSTINEILDEFERMGFGNIATNEGSDNLTPELQVSDNSAQFSSNLHIDLDNV